VKGGYREEGGGACIGRKGGGIWRIEEKNILLGPLGKGVQLKGEEAKRGTNVEIGDV